MANILRLFVLLSVVGLALGQLSQTASRDVEERLYKVEAIASGNSQDIDALRKLELDRRMTRIEVRLESIDGWAKLIGTSCIGALLTWAGSQFLKLVQSQRDRSSS